MNMNESLLDSCEARLCALENRLLPIDEHDSAVSFPKRIQALQERLLPFRNAEIKSFLEKYGLMLKNIESPVDDHSSYVSKEIFELRASDIHNIYEQLVLVNSLQSFFKPNMVDKMREFQPSLLALTTTLDDFHRQVHEASAELRALVFSYRRQTVAMSRLFCHIDDQLGRLEQTE